ncbi:ATPase [Thermogymnomonas acidicola]|uniref:ATPase n=1 Tax=Thermogymnomonas acidicola TaxID=399579 RepID=A0AA37BQW5_9ARCH|nr:PINc/VapC family ATPase [Thermogymnomonas acidicola]GGM71906.1 ATPase [Thermogymnomonas acidicola]
MDYVPDTSVIVDGRFTSFLSRKRDVRVILPEAMIAEVEHQANEGRAIGLAALEELKALRKMADEGKIYLEIQGGRPTRSEIRNARLGDIDNIIREVALENDATLVTGDAIQRDIAFVKGIKVEYIEHPSKSFRKIEEFFDEETTSVHLKAGLKPILKKGRPGETRYVESGNTISHRELESIANNIVKRCRTEPESFIELDLNGATVAQLGPMRIVITRPPFSDEMEITAVRPITKLSLEDYNLDAELVNRLKDQASGILIAGAPGAGKSTFVQALAEFLSDQGKMVKTMERPRDLQVKKQITQYTSLEGSMERTGDILLLVREDYTVFDEMRVTSDFKVFSDLRLAGVGMIGVVHATRPIDALQRFIGRIELGLIPQVVDTILFIRNGGVSSVLTTEQVVKIPEGMTQEDLARPVIVVRDFKTSRPLYEIYSYGEQVVVVPVNRSEATGVNSLAAQKIEEDLRRFLGTQEVKAELLSGSRARVFVPEEYIPKLIGKKGSTISEVEKRLNIKLEVEPLQVKPAGRRPVGVEIKNKIIYLDVGEKDRFVKVYVDDILILQAKSSSKGIIRIKINSETGAALYKYIKEGKRIECSFVD